jgi:hypothetical protein
VRGEELGAEGGGVVAGNHVCCDAEAHDHGTELAKVSERLVSSDDETSYAVLGETGSPRRLCCKASSQTYVGSRSQYPYISSI